jgi:hypothetical protein
MKQSAPLPAMTVNALPPVIDLRALDTNFGIGKTNAYLLASAGEIDSLTIGAPGKRGKRMFLTQSVLAYIGRRTVGAKPLNCKAASKGTGNH